MIVQSYPACKFHEVLLYNFVRAGVGASTVTEYGDGVRFRVLFTQVFAPNMGPVASFRGKGNVDGTEWGPVFKCKKDYVISNILLTIKGISYQWCVLSFNIYEIQGGKFVNILNKPIYHRIEKSNSKQRLDIQPEETIVLRGKRKYYISVMIVDSDRYGILDMQSHFKTSYARSISKGKKRKLPIGPAIQVKGYEIEQ